MNAKNRRVTKLRSKKCVTKDKLKWSHTISSQEEDSLTVASLQDQQELDEEICQKDGNSRDGRMKNKKKRGPSRGTMTLV